MHYSSFQLKAAHLTAGILELLPELWPQEAEDSWDLEGAGLKAAHLTAGILELLPELWPQEAEDSWDLEGRDSPRLASDPVLLAGVPSPPDFRSVE